jgi:transcriptional regulator with XRE-family HTH domain
LRSTDYFDPFFGMNHLGQAIQGLLDAEHLSRRELAARIGTTPTTLHGLANGRPCSPELLKLLCSKASDSVRWRYELLLAHLRDEVSRSGLNPDHVLLSFTESVKAGGNISLGIIAQAAESDVALQRMLDSVAEMCLRKAGQAVDGSLPAGPSAAAI